jgi:hypothetical protein
MTSGDPNPFPKIKLWKGWIRYRTHWRSTRRKNRQR